MVKQFNEMQKDDEAAAMDIMGGRGGKKGRIQITFLTYINENNLKL